MELSAPISDLTEKLISSCSCAWCHDDMSGCVCVCSYRCGSAGEPPGIPLSGTGHHTGHKLWPSHQLRKKRQEVGHLLHIHTHVLEKLYEIGRGGKKGNLKRK